MEMWLKRSTPVFLAVAVAAVVISAQEPVPLDSDGSNVTRPFGSPLILKCNVKPIGYGRTWVSWHFNRVGDSFSESRMLHEEMYNRSTNTTKIVPGERKVDDKDDEQILYNYNSSATYNDSGWYFCRVRTEIPKYRANVSAGTKVDITKSEEHSTHPSLPIVTVEEATVSPTAKFQLWHWIVLGVSAFILIFLLVMCILLRGKCRGSRAEDPVYANTRPVLKQPSPRPRTPADTLKTSSSTQNLRQPSPKRYDDNTRRHRR